MVDSNIDIDIDIRSTASSDISESLREQILGKGYSKTKYRKPTANSTKSKDTLHDFYIIQSGDLKSKPDSKNTYYSAASESGKTVEKDGFIIVPTDNKISHTPPSKESAGFVVVPKENKNNHSPRSKKSDSFVVVPKENKNSYTPQSERSDSFVMVPSKANSIHSMKNTDNRRYTTIETQTVAIQTVAIGTDPTQDAESSWGDNECNCPECKAQKRYQPKNKTPYIPDESSEPSIYCEGTDTSSPSVTYEGCYCKPCTCKCREWDYESSVTEQLSDSDDSFSTDFFDLPYQNNEEYLKLLRELEKKLLARNKERVRKTMMEFEKRSRQNQNLEKPICEYNCDDTASMLRKLASRNKKKPSCCKCGKKKVNSDILQNEKKWEKMNYVQSMVQEDDIKTTPNRVERSFHKSHWKLDPRPPHGDSNSDDYQPKIPPTGSICRKECCCRQKKRH